MKAQKLGLVLGMNMAVACMVLQGCKANRPGVGSGNPPSTRNATYVGAPEPAFPEPAAPATVAPAAQPSTTTVTTIETETEPVTTAEPSKVATVKQLPPPGKKPAPGKKATPVEATPAAPAAAPVAGSFVYTVKPGDQLFAVSRRYNVKMAAIRKANPNMDPNKIRVGQKITIPGVAAPAATVAAAGAPAKDAKVMQASAPAPVAANTAAPVKTKSAFTPYVGPTKEYKVRSGDSLGKIACENGITIRALKELNKLSKDTVRVGQTLLVPAEKVQAAAKPAAAKEEKAKKPFTKKDDAAKTAAAPAAAAPEAAKDKPAEVPAAAPEAKPAEKAPVTEAAAPVETAVEAPAAAPVPAPAAGPTYTVKEGDDLVSVAIAWGISPSALIDLNNLKAGDAIKPGQVLKLPASAKQSAQ